MRTYFRGKKLSTWAGLILCLLMGFVFVCIGTGIKQVEREELKDVTVRFDRCVVIAGDFARISLFDEDGNRYEIHAANGEEALARKLEALDAGTELELLLHPEEAYVLGIYEEGKPILDWQTAMQDIKEEDLLFSFLGVVMWVCGIVLFATEKISKKEK